MNLQFKAHAKCPKCGGRLGVWSGLRSVSPLSVRCPRCRQQLVIRFRGRILFVAVVAVAMAIGIFMLLRNLPHFSAITLMTRYVIIIIGWFLVEAGTAVFYFNFARFIPRTEPNGGANR